MIKDIHTHGPAPKPEAVISLGIKDLLKGAELLPGQAYSVGIHPWETDEEIDEEAWKILEEAARLPQVVAIGECGIDSTPKGGPMFRQLLVFKRQVELSELLAKPMIIHDVKGDDIIVGLRRDLKPQQPWAIHGFRRKPAVAQMLLRAGCWLSFGAEFNPETPSVVPTDRILAETDESTESIDSVISKIESMAGAGTDCVRNAANFLKIKE